VWKSTNAASANVSSVAFSELTDSVFSSLSQTVSSPSLSIGAVSVEPASLLAPGTPPVVLAGTGVANDTTASYFGDGILRSTNGGGSWTLIPRSSDETGGMSNVNFNFAGNGIAGFAWGGSVASPVVVAAVSQSEQGVELGTVNGNQGQSVLGIYYSLDLGQSWMMATITDGAGSLVQSPQMDFLSCEAAISPEPCGNAVTSVVWNPMRQRFYAAVRFHGYYESPDGQTWTRLESQPGANLTAAMCPAYQGTEGTPGSEACPIYNGVLAVQPVTGDTFALTTDINNKDQGLWRDVCAPASDACSSSTISFTQINDAALDTGGVIPQADYDLSLAAAPYQQGTTQDTLLFAGTADIYRCDLGAGCPWRNTTNTTASGCANSAQVAPAQYAIEATFSGRGLLYFGNDGGLWRSINGVEQTGPPCAPSDADAFENLNGAFQGSIATAEDIAIDPVNAQNRMVSLGPLGTASLLNGTGVWQQVLDGEGDDAAIDPANPNNWYATSESGIGINRCTTGPDCDGGFGLPVIDSADVGNDGNGQVVPAPWILDPQNPDSIIVGTCRVWRGPAAGGTDLNPLSTMLDGTNGSYCSGNAEIRSLAASGAPWDASGTAETIYAGMAGLFDGGSTVAGHIFARSVVPGSAASQWIDLSLNLNNFNPDGFDISDIYVDPNSPGRQTIYLTVQGFGPIHVYQSTDGGSTWENISSDLPNAPANGVVVDPNDSNTVYVATDAGVYYTQSVGSCGQISSSCWTLFGSSLPNVPVTQLVVSTAGAGPTLFAATYGRGVWQITLPSKATTSATVAPSSLTFAGRAMGSTSTPEQLLVTNTGSIPLQTGSIAVTGDFTESDTCVGASIAPGHACIVEVSFAPAKLGPESGLLTLYANVGSGGQISVPLDGTGLAGAAVTLTPTALCFQAALIGQTTSSPCQGAAIPPGQTTQSGQSIVIANTGGVAATLSSISITGDFKIVANTCGTSLAVANTPNDSCTVSILFTPTAVGNRSGTLTVAGSAGTLTAQLVGTGESVATDTISPTSLSFGQQTVGTASATQQIVMTNTGDGAVQIITVQSSTPDFVAENNCGTTLVGHASCAILVHFLPSQVGAESGILTVSDVIDTGAPSASAHQQSVTLTGTGVAPEGKASISPQTWNFGSYTVGRTSSSEVFTVTNNGAVTLKSLGMALSGDFAIATGSTTCGSSVAAGTSCVVGVTFTPTAAGNRIGALTVSATNLSTPLGVALSGSGSATAFTMQVEGAASSVITEGQTASFTVDVNGPQGVVALSCAAVPAANVNCSLPSSVTLTGSSTQSFTVEFAPTQQARRADSGWEKTGVALAMLAPVGFLGCRRRKWRALTACAVLALMVPIGCGITASAGSTSPGGSGTSPVSTPYALTVTGVTGGVTQSVAVKVDVE
jgi:hypothetical protein